MGCLLRWWLRIKQSVFPQTFGLGFLLVLDMFVEPVSELTQWTISSLPRS